MSDLTVEKLDQAISKKIPAKAAHNPDALLFEYVNDIPASNLWVLPREASEDGRYHIYVNPELAPVVSEWFGGLKKD